MSRRATPQVQGWGAYSLGWLIAAIGYALVLAGMQRVPPLAALASGIYQFGVAGLLGVLVWRSTARLPPTRFGSVVFGALHLAMAAGYAVAWVTLQHLFLLGVAPTGVATQVLRVSGPWMMMYGCFLYGCLAGGSYAVRATRALREQQVAAARAQLVALRAQLNPHFLFNALHSVTAMVRRDPRAAETALERIGELLRYTLDESSGDAVRLEDEWRFTRHYLDLEKIRLGDRLAVDAKFDDDALACEVPPFILQPLVENAVRHGLSVQPEGGRITIEARCARGRLLLSVSDDGAGADDNEIANAPGFGLSSVRRQVAARYPGAGRVSVHTATGKGFRVDVEIPARAG